MIVLSALPTFLIKCRAVPFIVWFSAILAIANQTGWSTTALAFAPEFSSTSKTVGLYCIVWDCSFYTQKFPLFYFRLNFSRLQQAFFWGIFCDNLTQEVVLDFLNAETKLYWSFSSLSWTMSGYLHSTMAKRSSNMYESQDWDCFHFSPLNLNLLSVWLLSGLNILSRLSNTVLGLSNSTPMEWRVIIHWRPIQFTMSPAFWASFISESGPWNKTLHSCLNCSNSDRQSFASQSNFGLLNCIAISELSNAYVRRVFRILSWALDHDKSHEIACNDLI